MGQESSEVKVSGSITALALSSDDKLIAIALEKRIDIYTGVGSTFQLVENSEGEPSNILQLSFSPNWSKVDISELSTEAAKGITTKLICTHGWGQNEEAILSIQQAIKDTLSKALDTHKSEHQTKLEGNTALFSPDGKFMICFNQDDAFTIDIGLRRFSRVIVWDVELKQPRCDLLGSSSGILWAGISPDSNLVGVIERDSAVLIRSVDSGNFICALDLSHTGGAWNGIFSPNSKQIALVLDGTGPSKIKIFDIATEAKVSEWECPAFRIESMDWSPNGKLLATAGHFGEFILWDVTSGLERMKWRPHQRGQESDADSYLASDIRFFDGGKKLLFNWSGVATMVYDLMSLAMHEFPPGAAGVKGPVWSRNAAFLLISHIDSTLRQWKLD
ncbi:hypothetical protein ACMYSQ_003939 [Aspergillus niger]